MISSPFLLLFFAVSLLPTVFSRIFNFAGFISNNSEENAVLDLFTDIVRHAERLNREDAGIHFHFNVFCIQNMEESQYAMSSLALQKFRKLQVNVEFIRQKWPSSINAPTLAALDGSSSRNYVRENSFLIYLNPFINEGVSFQFLQDTLVALEDESFAAWSIQCHDAPTQDRNMLESGTALERWIRFNTGVHQRELKHLVSHNTVYNKCFNHRSSFAIAMKSWDYLLPKITEIMSNMEYGVQKVRSGHVMESSGVSSAPVPSLLELEQVLRSRLAEHSILLMAVATMRLDILFAPPLKVDPTLLDATGSVYLSAYSLGLEGRGDERSKRMAEGRSRSEVDLGYSVLDYIEIGASHEDAAVCVMSCGMNHAGISVEPNTVLFQTLNMKTPNMHKSNCAIGTSTGGEVGDAVDSDAKDNKLSFYYIPPDTIQQMNLDTLLNQLGQLATEEDFDGMSIVKNLKEWGLPLSLIAKEDIKVKSFYDICRDAGLCLPVHSYATPMMVPPRKLRLLFVDAEGRDVDVIRSAVDYWALVEQTSAANAVDSSRTPSFEICVIQFEHVHGSTPSDDMEVLKEDLKTLGYDLVCDRTDCVADRGQSSACSSKDYEIVGAFLGVYYCGTILETDSINADNTVRKWYCGYNYWIRIPPEARSYKQKQYFL